MDPPHPTPPAKKKSSGEGGHLILQELPVKFHQLLPALQGRLSKGISKQHTSTSQGFLHYWTVGLPKFSGKLRN